MLTELKELTFANSVESVAKKLVKLDQSQYSYRVPHFRENLPVLREILEREINSPWGHNDLSFPHSVISSFKKGIGDRIKVGYGPESIPWTIAAVINTNDELIQRLPDGYLRRMLDVAIEVPVNHYYEKYRFVKKNAAYEENPERKKELRDAAAGHLKSARAWETYQEALRETISTTVNGEKES